MLTQSGKPAADLCTITVKGEGISHGVYKGAHKAANIQTVNRIVLDYTKRVWYHVVIKICCQQNQLQASLTMQPGGFFSGNFL